MHSLSKRYIATFDDLKKWCDHHRDITLLGIDTEFMRVRTYFPKLCLIQLATSSEVVVIDTISITDLSPLIALFADQNITKIIHSASQDLEALYTELKMMPVPVFDTQIAAHCLGLVEEGLLISYQEIVHRLLNVILEKDQTRTDWTQRPLTAAQLEYAFDDVRFLIALHDDLKMKLISGNHFLKFQNLMRELVNPLKYTPQFETAWRKVKHKNHLKSRRLSLLKHLAYAREVLAMEKNLPKRWVITDEQLIELAKHYGSSSLNINDSTVFANHAILKSMKKEINLRMIDCIRIFNSEVQDEQNS